jgi:hypothetical protein
MGGCCPELERFFARQIGDWTGLATGCREADLTGWLSFLPGVASAYRGDDLVAYRVRTAEDSGFTEPVQLYFRNDKLSMVGTEYWSLNPVENADLLSQLGAPPDRFDLPWRGQVSKGGDAVYATRGIALGVITETQAVVTVLVFPPCSPEDYRARYAPVEMFREFPIRRSAAQTG